MFHQQWWNVSNTQIMQLCQQYSGDASGRLQAVADFMADRGHLDSLKAKKSAILIANNLVSSSLSHSLKCVDPPASLRSQILGVFADFIWSKLHWVS